MGFMISGVEVSLEDVVNLRLKAYSVLEGHTHWSSILKAYSFHETWLKNTKVALHSSCSVATEAGFSALVLLGEDQQQVYSEYCFSYLSCPVSFRSFEIWSLMQVVQRAELNFLKTCSKPDSEESLTGALLQLLESTADAFVKEHASLFESARANLILKKMELQVQHRERQTGGDFALILEWREPGGQLNFCPVIFQAKRVEGLRADLSQCHKKSGYQFDVLARSKSNSSYIFYNCKSRDGVEKPRLPTVKKVSDIDEGEKRVSTCVVEGALSLSIFLLDIFRKERFFYAKSRREAMAAILAGGSEFELRDIIVFSPDSSAMQEYHREREILQRLRNRPAPSITEQSF